MTIKELLQIKDAGTYEITALMVRCSVETGKNGSSFTLATFQDQYGSFEARKWDTDLATKCEVNQVLDLEVEAKEYMGKLNFTIKNFALNNSLDPKEFTGDFTPDVEGMKTYLRDMFRKLYATPEYDTLLSQLFAIDKGLFFDYPAAKGMHHDLKHGLLFHTVAMLKHAESLIKSTKEMYGEVLDIDENLIYVAIIIHDYFKIKEYIVNDAYKADVSKFVIVGHITMATGFIASMYYLNKIDEDTYIRLTNAVAAHHGELEYGSPVVPATIEAFIVHTVDRFDSRVYMFADEVRKIDKGQLSANRNYGLGTNVFR